MADISPPKIFSQKTIISPEKERKLSDAQDSYRIIANRMKDFRIKKDVKPPRSAGKSVAFNDSVQINHMNSSSEREQDEDQNNDDDYYKRFYQPSP